MGEGSPSRAAKRASGGEMKSPPPAASSPRADRKRPACRLRTSSTDLSPEGRRAGALSAPGGPRGLALAERSIPRSAFGGRPRLASRCGEEPRAGRTSVGPGDGAVPTSLFSSKRILSKRREAPRSGLPERVRADGERKKTLPAAASASRRPAGKVAMPRTGGPALRPSLRRRLPSEKGFGKASPVEKNPGLPPPSGRLRPAPG